MTPFAPAGPPELPPPTPAPTTSSEAERLLAKWRAGDEAALEQMLTLIHPMLYRWAIANAADVDDAEDIAQQALVTVYRKIRQFRGESPFAVWLYRLTARTAAQRRRTTARRKLLDIRAHAEVAKRVYETDPGARVDRERLTATVREAYEQLPPQQRAALTLVDIEGYTPGEAAEVMELAPVTLRANLFKARARVRRRVFESSPALAERFAKVAAPEEAQLSEHPPTKRIAS
jgi:RNA polymerase sigma-70 factor, ECF subfamily